MNESINNSLTVDGEASFVAPYTEMSFTSRSIQPVQGTHSRINESMNNSILEEGETSFFKPVTETSFASKAPTTFQMKMNETINNSLLEESETTVSDKQVTTKSLPPLQVIPPLPVILPQQLKVKQDISKPLPPISTYQKENTNMSKGKIIVIVVVCVVVVVIAIIIGIAVALSNSNNSSSSTLTTSNSNSISTTALTTTTTITTTTTGYINWKNLTMPIYKATWSMNCDFPGNDIGQITVQTGNVTYCLNQCILQGYGCSHVVYDSTGVTGGTPGNCSLKLKAGVSSSDAVVYIGLFCGIMI